MTGLAHRGSPRQAETLAGLLAHPDTISAYRARARLHAQAHYSWERVTDQYEALLRPATSRL